MKSYLHILLILLFFAPNIVRAEVKSDILQVNQSVKKVTGQVVDEKDQPMPGVSVVITGTQLGVSTDVKGNFNISVPNMEKFSITFSFIGMEKKVVQYKGQKFLKVILKEEKQTLKEVVVTGMQTVEKEKMTGAVETITSAEIQSQGCSSIDKILEGRIAGVNSFTSSGDPNKRAKITIRGANDLEGDSNPLWIVDDMPATIDVMSIPPEDVKSITILKDAAATAIYGARAANGVIVITTKKGFKGRPSFSYNMTTGVAQHPKIDLDFMNAEQKVDFENSLCDEFGQYTKLGRVGYLRKRLELGTIKRSDFDAEIARLKSVNNSWWDKIFRNSLLQNHHFTARGGSDEMTYYASIKYSDNKGILLNNNRNTLNTSISLDYKPNEKLLFQASFNNSYVKGTETASSQNPFKYAVYANPYEEAYNEDGSYAYDESWLPANFTNLKPSMLMYDKFNILNEIENNTRRNKSNSSSFTMRLRYRFFDGFVFKSSYSYSKVDNYSNVTLKKGTYESYRTSGLAKRFFPGIPLPDKYNLGSWQESASYSSSWTARNSLEYMKKIKKHWFNVFVASEISSTRGNNFRMSVPFYDDEYRLVRFPTYPTSLVEDNPTYNGLNSIINGCFGTGDSQDRSVSWISNFRYSYDDKYVLSGSVRADAADIIGEDAKYQPLWSVGLKWNLHNENFIKSLGFINRLSLNYSYGFTGMIDRSAYPFSSLTVSGQKLDDEYMASSFTYANPCVKWAKKKDRNFGFEVMMFDRFVDFHANYFENRTDDILGTIQIPISSGRSTIKSNTSSVGNKGYELSLNLNWIKNKDWFFSTRVTACSNVNKVYKAYNSFDNVKATKNLRGGQLRIIGADVSEIYGWRHAGIDPNTGLNMYYLTQDGKDVYARILNEYGSYNDWKQGYIHEYNGLPDMINVPDATTCLGSQISYHVPLTDEMQIQSMSKLGCLNPKVYGGIYTNLRYKKWNLRTSWSYKAGHIVPVFCDTHYSGSRYMTEIAASRLNRQVKYFNRWRMAGDITDVVSFSEFIKPSMKNLVAFDKNYEKGDYLACKSIELSYEKFNSKGSFFKKFRASIEARNVFVLTRYSGIDATTQGQFNYPIPFELHGKLSIDF